MRSENEKVKNFWLLNKFSLLASKEMLGEYAYWCWGVKGYGSKINSPFGSSQNLLLLRFMSLNAREKKIWMSCFS